MADDSEAKHGGGSGKKDGVSGSSFFTWFMVLALLGVWTSVAVVWLDLVDYEEVLDKLGVYDADGDGDFDIEDAKLLLGWSPAPLAEKAAKATDVSRSKSKTKEEVKEGIKEQLKKVKEKYLAPLKEAKKGERDRSSKDQVKKSLEKLDKAKKDNSKGRREQEKPEGRRRDDEKPRETTKRTTSGRTSSEDRGKKTEKKAERKP